MKPSRGHLDYLRDIVEMMNKIERFTRGIDFDPRTQVAGGESAQRGIAKSSG